MSTFNHKSDDFHEAVGFGSITESKKDFSEIVHELLFGGGSKRSEIIETVAKHYNVESDPQAVKAIAMMLLIAENVLAKGAGVADEDDSDAEDYQPS